MRAVFSHSRATRHMDPEVDRKPICCTLANRPRAWWRLGVLAVDVEPVRGRAWESGGECEYPG